MKHDYTNDEIRDAWKDSVSLCEFLDALPERPQAQAGPWPGQQEAIDAAMIEASKVNGAHYDLFAASPHRWPGHWLDEAPARLAIAQAYDAARPQAAEIAKLKAALAESEKQFQDKVCEIARLLDERDKAQAELAALRQPILVDDGRSLVDIYGDAFAVAQVQQQLPMKECCDSGFKAVAAVVLAQAVRRIEAVPVEGLKQIWYPIETIDEAFEVVRAIFIAAAKGEGQAKEVPQVELDPYAELKSAHAAGKKVEFECKFKGSGDWQMLLKPNWDKEPDRYRIKPEPAKSQPTTSPGWTPENAKAFEEFQGELQETWKSQPTTSPGWTPAVGDTVRSIPEMPLGGQMYWRDLAIQIARVWWKCHNIGASLQHGDLDKDIAFSIVCKRHGGRAFHGDTPENAWHKAEEWLLSPDRENFQAACLTPAKP